MITSSHKAAIFTAPAGWGKTRRAEALAKEHGFTKVVDDWGGTRPAPITEGALHLTNLHPDVCRRIAPGVQLISRGW